VFIEAAVIEPMNSSIFHAVAISVTTVIA